MSATTTELDQRHSNGITVTLFWNRHSGATTVHVDDQNIGEGFEFRCKPSDALNAFHHPYAYAHHRGPRDDRTNCDRALKCDRATRQPAGGYGA